MKKLYKAFIVALLSLSSILYAGQNNGMDNEFIQEDNYYSFRGSFIVKAKLDCLLNVIYDFKKGLPASGLFSVRLCHILLFFFLL